MSAATGRIRHGVSATWLVAVALFAIVAGAASESASAGQETAASKHEFEVVDSSQLYYGRKKHPKSPAHCDADSIWAEIPEYKTIIEEELGPEDPRYHLLLKRATKRFQGALKKLAKREGHDVIGETGSIKAIGKKKKTISVVTKDLIDLVTRD